MRHKVNKKVGVNRRQATAADVAKAKSDAITTVWAIFFSVMRDKEGYGLKRLKRLWDEVTTYRIASSKAMSLSQT